MSEHESSCGWGTALYLASSSPYPDHHQNGALKIEDVSTDEAALQRDDVGKSIPRSYRNFFCSYTFRQAQEKPVGFGFFVAPSSWTNRLRIRPQAPTPAYGVEVDNWNVDFGPKLNIHLFSDKTQQKANFNIGGLNVAFSLSADLGVIFGVAGYDSRAVPLAAGGWVPEQSAVGGHSVMLGLTAALRLELLFNSRFLLAGLIKMDGQFALMDFPNTGLVSDVSDRDDIVQLDRHGSHSRNAQWLLVPSVMAGWVFQ